MVKIAAAIHKSDVGGVALGLTTPQAAADAVTVIRARLSEAGLAGQAAEFLVQDQIRDGVEMIIRAQAPARWSRWRSSEWARCRRSCSASSPAGFSRPTGGLYASLLAPHRRVQLARALVPRLALAGVLVELVPVRCLRRLGCASPAGLHQLAQ